MDEQLMARQVPHDLDAEQSVLGSILIDSRCITELIGLVQPEDFYLQQNKEILGLLVDLQVVPLLFMRLKNNEIFYV